MDKMETLIKNLNKQAKEEIITVGLGAFNYKRIPFTSPRMNYCTFGGLPVGKLIEFYGEEHGGKTTTALDIVANYQHSDDTRGVLYCDCENTLDVEWATKLGVDVDKMYILQPKSQSAEQVFQFICDAVDTGEIGLFVIDSLGAMMSQQELDKTMEDKTYGGISKPLTLFAKRVEMLMQRHKCTGIGINQMREDMNSMWGGQTTPGGKGWKHLCAVRLQFSRGKFIDDKGNQLTKSAEAPAGNLVLMSITKNKTCPPTRRTGFYTLRYDTGIDYTADLIDVAIKYGVISKRGAWFDIVDVNTGEVIEGNIQGQSNVVEFLEDSKNASVLQFVEQAIDSLLKEE